MPHTATANIATGRGFSWSPLKVLANSFDWFANLADRTPRGVALNALAALTDEELAARGTTRLTEARRILGPHWYI